MNEMDKYVGKILSGKYEITDAVGLGGMSVVFKAKDIYNGRTVAIKLLKDEYKEDLQFKGRFINESRVISMLSHKNIVDVLDVHIGEDVSYIVMEYVDGITLKQYMSKRGALDWRETVYFADQILKGLYHAHSKGIVHRDIKPHNIMLLPDGTIKVADFGIARFRKLDNTLSPEKAIGTVQYISPEQAVKGTVDEKSDIYSLGITMYEMLTGVLPFDGDSPVNIAYKQIREVPKKLTEIKPDIPKGLEEIVLKAISKVPSNRYSSAEEMREAIIKIKENPLTVFNYKISNDVLNENGKEEVKVKKQKKKKNGFFARHCNLFSVPVLLGIVLGSILSIFGWYFVKDFIGSANEGYVGVPNFIGQLKDTVINNDEYNEMFRFTVTESYSETYEAGIIISQTPERNTKVIEGTTVKLVVSKGIKTTEIPKIVGDDVDVVSKILQNLGFTVKSNYIYNDSVAEKCIISCDPAEGSSVPYGSTVILTVSRGRQTQLIRVPGVVGKDYNEAFEMLSEKGLTVIIEYEHDDDVSVNRVISQSVAVNTQVEAGTKITIVVSEGPYSENASSETDFESSFESTESQETE